MTRHSTAVEWKEGLLFEGQQQGQTLWLVGSSAEGGERAGFSPKQLVLTGLAGCTAMDVASLLPKMRVEFSAFRVEVDGDLSADHPRTYERIRLRYIVRAAVASRPSIEQAIRLSIEKYCGVYAMLATSAAISHELILED